MKTINQTELPLVAQAAILANENPEFVCDFVEVRIANQVIRNPETMAPTGNKDVFEAYYGKDDYRSSISLDVTPELQAWFESL